MCSLQRPSMLQVSQFPTIQDHSGKAVHTPVSFTWGKVDCSGLIHIPTNALPIWKVANVLETWLARQVSRLYVGSQVDEV